MSIVIPQGPNICRYGVACRRGPACRYIHCIPMPYLPTSFLMVPPKTNLTSAGMAILNPSKTAILMVRGTRTGLWSLPKGGAESSDDSVLATAIREVKEETGLGLSVDYSIPDESSPYVGTFADNHTYHIFRAVATSEELRTPLNAGEIAEVAWVPLAGINGGKAIKANHITRMFLQEQKMVYGATPSLW